MWRAQQIQIAVLKNFEKGVCAEVEGHFFK